MEIHATDKNNAIKGRIEWTKKNQSKIWIYHKMIELVDEYTTGYMSQTLESVMESILCKLLSFLFCF